MERGRGPGHWDPTASKYTHKKRKTFPKKTSAGVFFQEVEKGAAHHEDAGDIAENHWENAGNRRFHAQPVASVSLRGDSLNHGFFFNNGRNEHLVPVRGTP
jgi:hypothetical protein